MVRAVGLAPPVGEEVTSKAGVKVQDPGLQGAGAKPVGAKAAHLLQTRNLVKVVGGTAESKYKRISKIIAKPFKQ